MESKLAGYIRIGNDIETLYYDSKPGRFFTLSGVALVGLKLHHGDVSFSEAPLTQEDAIALVMTDLDAVLYEDGYRHELRRGICTSRSNVYAEPTTYCRYRRGDEEPDEVTGWLVLDGSMCYVYSDRLLNLSYVILPDGLRYSIAGVKGKTKIGPSAIVWQDAFAKHDGSFCTDDGVWIVTKSGRLIRTDDTGEVTFPSSDREVNLYDMSSVIESLVRDEELRGDKIGWYTYGGTRRPVFLDRDSGPHFLDNNRQRIYLMGFTNAQILESGQLRESDLKGCAGVVGPWVLKGGRAHNPSGEAITYALHMGKSLSVT